MNNFERGVYKNIRFETSKGLIRMEDIKDLPLKGRGIDLNTLAKKYHKLIKEDVDCDFVDSAKPDVAYTDNKLRFDIIISVIEHKKAIAAKSALAAQTKDEGDQIMDALEAKKLSDLQGMTVAQLEAKLAALKA